MLCHPFILRGPPRQAQGVKSEVAASPLPSCGPKRGRKCHVTPAFSGIPNAKCTESNEKCSPTKENKIRSGCLTPASSGPKGGWTCYVTFALEKIPHKGEKIKSGCLTLAFWGAQRWAETLRHVCILENPPQRGTKSEVPASPVPSRRPERGRKSCVASAFSGIRNAEHGEQNYKWSLTKSKRAELN